MDTLSIILSALLLILTTVFIKIHTWTLYKAAKKLPMYNGFFSFEIARRFWVDKSEILSVLHKFLNEPFHDQELSSFWFGPNLVINIKSPQDLEQVLTSTEVLKKSMHYTFLDAWLGKGLLVSTGALWHSRRKLLTPTFHFKILENYIDVFNANLDTLINKLNSKVGKGSFNVDSFCTTYSLDIIAETAMSTKLNAQKQESKLAIAVKGITECIAERAFKVLLYPSFIFNMTSLAKQQQEHLSVIDGNIRDMIKKQKSMIIDTDAQAEDDFGQKKRVNFMQLLLKSENENHLSENDVRDEVNTFFFEGHDTTSSAMNFALYLLSNHPDVQEKIYDEVLEISKGSEEHLGYRELQALKYTERVIKETLRLFPSVPYIGREVEKDFVTKSGYTIPAGATILLYIYGLHRNEKVFPDPEKFDPERFLPEKCAEMHPYSYIPFSAGSRNCIGQKFAMLELKSFIAGIVKNFRLLPSGKTPHQVSHLILRSGNGYYIQVEKRT